jgi:hypothetical protein
MSRLFHHRRLALLSLAALTVSACSESGLPLSSSSTSTPPTVPTADREAATAESWTVPASQGGNGSPSDRKTESDCFQGLYESNQMICFVLRNNTLRLTSTPNITAKFPLTVARFFSANPNTALGGRQDNNADGSLAVTSSQNWDNCGADCAGRLTPNPFTESAIMQFQSWSTWRGAKARIQVSSEVSPMGGVQRPAEMEYDAPKWSNTNYSQCINGDYFTCREISIPDGGGRSKPVYEVGTRPMDITLSFQGGANYTLVRRGEPITSGLLLDPALNSGNVTRIKANDRARYAGYRSVGDQSTASFLATYVVGNADGITDRATCESGAVRVLGCGSTITVEMALDKDGKPTTTSRCVAINLTSQTRFSCRTPTFTGPNDGVILANVDISDVAVR